ncbi:MAG: hypothetical protein ACJ745_01695, partial [Actinomycetes bacterium]
MALVTRLSVLLDEPRSNLDTITRAPQNAGQRCPTRMRRARARCGTGEYDVETCPAFWLSPSI